MQIAAPKGLLPPGIHSLSVELSVPGGQREQGAAGDIEVNNIRPREMRERLVVQSFFKVVNPWLSVFPVVGDTGSRELSRDLWGPWEGVTAPRFALAGLLLEALLLGRNGPAAGSATGAGAGGGCATGGLI